MPEEITQTPSPVEVSSEPITPSTSKMVLESDLIAVKKGAEKKEGELLSQIAESNRLKDEAHTKFLEATAAKEQFEEQAKEGATLKTKVGELETNLSAAEESRKQLEEQLLGMKRTRIATNYGVSEDSLKDKDINQLKNLEDAFQLVKGNGKPANYDLGPSGTTPAGPTTILEGMKQELAQAKELRAKKSLGDSDYNP